MRQPFAIAAAPQFNVAARAVALVSTHQGHRHGVCKMTAELETFAANRGARRGGTAERNGLPDRELIVRIAAGDRDAMGVLYARHHENIYRFAHRMVRSAQAA